MRITLARVSNQKLLGCQTGKRVHWTDMRARAGVADETDCTGYVTALRWGGRSGPNEYPLNGNVSADLCAVPSVVVSARGPQPRPRAPGYTLRCSLLLSIRSMPPRLAPQASASCS